MRRRIALQRDDADLAETRCREPPTGRPCLSSGSGHSCARTRLTWNATQAVAAPTAPPRDDPTAGKHQSPLHRRFRNRVSGALAANQFCRWTRAIQLALRVPPKPSDMWQRNDILQGFSILGHARLLGNTSSPGFKNGAGLQPPRPATPRQQPIRAPTLDRTQRGNERLQKVGIDQCDGVAAAARTRHDQRIDPPRHHPSGRHIA